MSAPHIQVMSRRQCGLCEAAKRVIKQAAEHGWCTWESVDVDRDKALLLRYGMDVPVVLVNGTEHFRHRIEQEALATVLEAYAC